MFGLIFDMDGVLADTEGPIAQATMKVYQDLYGITLTPQDFVPFIGTGAVRYTEGPAKKLGIEIDLERALEERTRNFFDIIHAGDNIAFPGVHALLDAAHEHPGWLLALATSSPGEKSRGTLAAAGIDATRFVAYLHGDLVVHKKPHPEIYLKTIESLELRPQDCVVVEDAVAGVEAAKAAGIHVVAVTNSFSRAELAQADWLVDSLEEVTLDRLQTLIEERTGQTQKRK
jgi:beta-phosphoglucomutase